MKKLVPFFLAVVLLTGCGNFVSVKVLRPAEISTAQYKKAAIGNVFASNTKSSDVANFRSTLITELQKKKYFEILDTRMGMPSGTDVLIINANILNSDYTEEITKGDPYEDKEGKTHIDQKRTGNHTLSINYQLNSINGVIIGTKNTEDLTSISNSATDIVPAVINRDGLILQNLQKSIANFLRAIIPYEERVSVELKSDESMPELTKGIEAAENGLWDISIKNFMKASSQTSNPLVHYAYYNLGVAYMYTYDFQNARTALRKALEMKGSESAYKKAYQELDRMEQDEIKLQEQRK